MSQVAIKNAKLMNSEGLPSHMGKGSSPAVPWCNCLNAQALPRAPKQITLKRHIATINGAHFR